MTNGPAFIFQVLLIFWIIYIAVPKFLFNKKYFYFILATLPIILICAFISAELIPKPPLGRPPFQEMGRGRGPGPSRFFIHLLVLFISSVSAVLLETFILAEQKEKEMALAKAELMESELKFLKMQINPHFLFNALNNIYALSVTNSDKTQEGISTLSLMLRYVLYDCERPNVPLNKELEYISHFIDLFKLKSSKEFNINIINEVQDDSIMVAPMIFVPFIENAFKHSGIEKGGDSFVNISIKSIENNIEFSVENSLPIEPLIIDEHGGIGLQNVQKRLDILYPNQHQLEINKLNTFKVHLKLNIK
jgi:LytS/YehU family sensor histidine kinase